MMSADHGELLGVIPKTQAAEVRVYVKTHKGRRVVDVRLWYVPAGSTDFVPTRKGVTFDASKIDRLRNALEAA
jgi:hypothetical protein